MMLSPELTPFCRLLYEDGRIVSGLRDDEKNIERYNSKNGS
jgi:hypothetical protein